jgi:GntR family transcriptional regulator/MocR family aminotransferase
MGTAAYQSLCLRIDPRARASLQLQIYDGIRRAILEGIVAPRAQLLSSRALAADLGVSRTTTVLAYEQLLAEGYLQARRGSGTFVASALPDDLPQTIVVHPGGTPKHPPLSRRGAVLATLPAAARRLPGPARAFRLGLPALDLFPIKQWSQLVNRRLRSATLAQLDYSHPAGVRALREAIANHVCTARGTKCSADQVIVVAGAQRGLDLICNVLLDAGDEAWVEDPGYPGMRAALIACGARIRPVRVDDHGAVVERLARVAPHARLGYVTPSHQFPTGVPMSLSRRLALLRWASSAGAWIVEDDYDSEFRYGSRPIPCLHGLDGDGRVIYVGTFSKALFPSLRLGFLIVPADLHDRLVAVRRATDLHPPALDQLVLADFMNAGHFDRHIRRMRGVYGERLEVLASAAKRYCAGALRIRPTHTGLHAVADVDGMEAAAVSAQAEARGVEVMPLSEYWLGRPAGRDGLMLGFAAVRPDALNKGMERLADAIEAAADGGVQCGRSAVAAVERRR